MALKLIFYSLCLPLHLFWLLVRVTVCFVPWKMKLLLLGFCMFTAISVPRLHKGMLIIKISVPYLGRQLTNEDEQNCHFKYLSFQWTTGILSGLRELGH